MIQESFAILKRNLNIILNAKLSFLIIFLGPVLLMLVAGAILQDTSLKSLEIGIYTSNQSDLTEDEFIKGFQENLYLGGSNVYQEASVSDCVDKVLRMKYHACVEIKKSQEYVPVENTNFGTLDMPSYELTTHVDYSQTASAWKIISAIQTAAETKYAEMTQERMAVVVARIDTIISQLESQRGSISSARENIRSIKTSIQDLDAKLVDTQNKINLIKQEITDIQSRLNGIDTAYPEGIAITDQIRNNLLSIQGNLSSIQENYSLNSLNFMSQLTELEDDLTEMQYNLDRVVSDWNQLKQTQLSQVSRQITYKSQSLSGSEAYDVEKLGFIDYLFPTFLMFFMVFVCLIFPTNLIIRERISNSQIRNMTSKTSGLKFGVNNFLSCILVIITQVIILLLISQFFLNADIFFRTVSMIAIIIVSVCTLSLLGMVLGYMFNKFESAVIASVSLSIIILILLPGITPTNLLPTAIAPLVKNFLPVIFENKLRTLIIFGAPIYFSALEIVSIILTSALLVALTVLLYNRSKREI